MMVYTIKPFASLLAGSTFGEVGTTGAMFDEKNTHSYEGL